MIAGHVLDELKERLSAVYGERLHMDEGDAFHRCGRGPRCNRDIRLRVTGR